MLVYTAEIPEYLPSYSKYIQNENFKRIHLKTAFFQIVGRTT